MKSIDTTPQLLDRLLDLSREIRGVVLLPPQERMTNAVGIAGMLHKGRNF